MTGKIGKEDGKEEGAAILTLITTASLVAQRLKRLPPMRESRIRSLGREDPLEKEMAIPPVCLPGESHGQRSLVGYSVWGCKESDMTEQHSHTHTYIHYRIHIQKNIIIKE